MRQSRRHQPKARSRNYRIVTGSLALLMLLVLAATAAATVAVSRAELSGGRLRIEGTALPSRSITVDGVGMGTSNTSGEFRIERDGFTAPADCTVDVNDGSATPTNVRLSGCTVTTTPPPPPPDAVAELGPLTVAPDTVVGGNPSTGTVTLTASAPDGGFVVALSSDRPTVATVPPSVTVPAGQTSATFTISTVTVTGTNTFLIRASAAGIERADDLTVTTQTAATTGTISLARGGTGSGRVTSQPPGVDCTFTATTTSGACNNVVFPAGTAVKLDARPANGSRFLGWEAENSCPDAPRVVIQATVAHICRPAFARR